MIGVDTDRERGGGSSLSFSYNPRHRVKSLRVPSEHSGTLYQKQLGGYRTPSLLSHSGTLYPYQLGHIEYPRW
jgi:hypothetical protein